jgi:hypothetical protein
VKRATAEKAFRAGCEQPAIARQFIDSRGVRGFDKRKADMFRVCLIFAAFWPLTSTPQAPATEPAPIEVTGRVSAIDPQIWIGFDSGPGLFMTVQNVSARGMQGYVYETIFTDPASGTLVEHRSHSAYRQPSLGVSLPAGGKEQVVKPYPVRITASGVPANYSFDVDLVVFEDGTTWGPAKTQAARQLLSRVQGASPKRQ